ncbi:MAG: hypothetical protein MUF64_27785, partial [Polyangiaceae bacterium]|nr:hypothetical protein [Polyangiaceae bacterium]
MSQASLRAGGSMEIPYKLRRGAWVAAITLLSFDALVIAAGEAPREALWRALSGTWGTAYGLGQVVYKATPLLLSG